MCQYNTDTQDVSTTLYSLTTLPTNPIEINDSNLNIGTFIYPHNGLAVGDSIFLTGLVGSIGGLDAASFNNQTFQVLSIVDANTFTILFPNSAYFSGVYGGT